MPLTARHNPKLSSVFPISFTLCSGTSGPTFPMMKGWFSIIPNTVLWCKQAISLWNLEEMGGSGSRSGVLFTFMKKTLLAVLTCSLALGGATIGTISGAIKGQTTETGFLRGAAIGAVAGAITAVQLVELTLHGEPFSKVALLFSLINGKVFREWVSPALLKAYQWQISTVEASLIESSDVFEMDGTRGLSHDSITKLPKCEFHPRKTLRSGQERSCIICLEDVRKGELMRILQNCGHYFHLQCIDEWLIRHGSCPICRKDVSDEEN